MECLIPSVFARNATTSVSWIKIQLASTLVAVFVTGWLIGGVANDIEIEIWVQLPVMEFFYVELIS